MSRSPREITAQVKQQRQQQERLLKDLLNVVDALDRAADHWQKAEADQASASPVAPGRSATVPTWLHRLGLSWLWRLGMGSKAAAARSPDPLPAMISSAHQGIEMIRESMLSVLRKHHVEPIEALGQPFDANHMHALGQRPDATVCPNTVVQEVVRAYVWQDRLLREAQVIVSVTQADQR